MSISTKNQLQERYQKQGLELPTYQSTRLPSPDHIPQWQSHVYLPDRQHHIKGDVCSKKSLAELSAATNALTFLAKHHTDEIPSSSQALPLGSMQEFPPIATIPEIVVYGGNPSTVLLVDLDNQSNFLTSEKAKQYQVFCFASKGAPLPADIPYHCTYATTMVKDAADHTLTFEAGKLAATLPKSVNFIILSRDHFGEIVANLLREHGFEAQHYTDIRQLE